MARRPKMCIRDRDDGADGDEDVLAEEEPDVVGACRHAANAEAGLVGQGAMLGLGRALGHGGDQGTHHLRMTAQRGQAQSGCRLTHQQIDQHLSLIHI